MKDNILCFDLGGTNIKYGLVSSDGEVTKNDAFKSPATYDEMIISVKETYEKFKEEVQPVICISSPANYIEGKMQGSSFLAYIIGEDIISDIENATNTKCYIENDGNCTTLGEYYFGKHKGVKGLVTLAIGSGIGGGIIIEDRLIKGSHFVGGELGYPLTSIELGEERPYALFGSRCGISNLVTQGLKLDKNVDSGEYIYNSTDPIFDELKSVQLRTIAMQIINLQYIIDPDVILIGGNISKNEHFINGIKKELEAYYEKLVYHDVHSEVDSVTFYNDNNLIGASTLYWRKK